MHALGPTRPRAAERDRCPRNVVEGPSPSGVATTGPRANAFFPLWRRSRLCFPGFVRQRSRGHCEVAGTLLLIGLLGTRIESRLPPQFSDSPRFLFNYLCTERSVVSVPRVGKSMNTEKQTRARERRPSKLVQKRFPEFAPKRRT